MHPIPQAFWFLNPLLGLTGKVSRIVNGIDTAIILYIKITLKYFI